MAKKTPPKPKRKPKRKPKNGNTVLGKGLRARAGAPKLRRRRRKI